jgi:HEAT repeat protein
MEMRRSAKQGLAIVVLVLFWSAGLVLAPSPAKAQSVEDLILSLEQGNRNQKLEAIKQLGKLGDVRALRPLLSSLQDRTDDKVREESAKALGQIGDKRAVPILITRLREERVPIVRARIAESLGLLKDPRAVEALAHATQDTELHWIRLYAAWALGEIRDGRAIAPLLNMFLTGEHPFVHNEAKVALLKCADVWYKVEKGDVKLRFGSIPRKRIKTLKQFLIEMLTDPSDQIRLMAARALGKYADAEGVEYLRRVAARDNSPSVRKAARKALKRFGY